MIKRWLESWVHRTLLKSHNADRVLRRDRRRDPRFEDGQTTWLQPATTLVGRSKAVEILDGNMKGLRLASKEPLRKGSRHWITVHFQGIAARFLVDIRWTRSVGGQYQSGATMTPIDRNSELHLLTYYHHIQRLCRQRSAPVL